MKTYDTISLNKIKKNIIKTLREKYLFDNDTFSFDDDIELSFLSKDNKEETIKLKDFYKEKFK